MTAAAMRSQMMTLENCAATSLHGPGPCRSWSSFRPWHCSRRRASLSVMPSSEATSSARTDSCGRECQQIPSWAGGQAATAFVVGGPDGLDAQTRRGAERLLRLSSLTLPHALAQVVLAEQLYRAATRLTGHPYHRE